MEFADAFRSKMKLKDKNLFKNIKLVVLDFDGVMTDNIVYTSENGKEFVACWRGDGIGLSNIKKLGILITVLSTERNPVVTKRCEKLEIDCIQGCDNKIKALKALIRKHKSTMSQVLYMGNDVNDYDCLEQSGVPVVVADAHPDVLPLAKYVTNAYGGRGAVREVCDLIVKYNKI